MAIFNIFRGLSTKKVFHVNDQVEMIDFDDEDPPLIIPYQLVLYIQEDIRLSDRSR